MAPEEAMIVCMNAGCNGGKQPGEGDRLQALLRWLPGVFDWPLWDRQEAGLKGPAAGSSG